MVLPGFLGDLIGLLCLLPVTRGLVRGVLTRLVLGRLPDRTARPRCASRACGRRGVGGATAYDARTPLVIEGEIVREPDGRRPRRRR